MFERNLVAGCKDSIGWMFSKLDTSNDLYLDHSELAAINLEKYEVCIRPFFNSCDSYRDGKVSTAEWCLCFWRESESFSFSSVTEIFICLSVSLYHHLLCSSDSPLKAKLQGKKTLQSISQAKFSAWSFFSSAIRLT